MIRKAKTPKKMLFITYIDPQKTASGSSVRPVMMLRAFEQIGVEPHLVYGKSNQLATRFRAVKDTCTWLEQNRPAFCYVEPPSGPLFCFCDHLLLIKLKMMKIPTAIFIRDAFWKVPETWGPLSLKRLILETMSRFDWLIYKLTMEIMYFPTQRMADLFKTPCIKKILPPGGNLMADSAPRENLPKKTTLVYVGAIADRYGSDILFQAYQIVAALLDNIELNVVCREDEWQNFSPEFKGLSGVTIHHIQGEKLTDLYRRCDIALIPIRKSAYMDFAMPIKLFEYLSFHLPVVVTDCAEVAEFVTRHALGLVTGSDAVSFASGIITMVNNPETQEKFRLNAEKTLKSGHLWTDRARQVLAEMGGG